MPDPIDWNLFIQLKTAVAGELEKLRVAGTIGGNLDAEVEVFAKDEFREKLMALGGELRFLLITSEAQVKRVSNAAGPPVGAIKVARYCQGGRRLDPRAGVRGAQVRTLLAPSAGSRVQHGASDLCGRCVENLTEPGETRRFV